VSAVAVFEQLLAISHSLLLDLPSNPEGATIVRCRSLKGLLRAIL
jgi:hypothetical protein